MFPFLGMTMALGVDLNPHMELTAYILLFTGTILMMTSVLEGMTSCSLLRPSAGFLLVGHAFLETETAIQIANNYGIALS